MRPSKQKISIKCSECDSTVAVRKDTYNANVKRNGHYLCHHCSTIKAGKEGKYSHTHDARSKRSKALWEREEFRSKISNTSNNKSIEYVETQRNRTIQLWQDPNYRTSVSQSVRNALSDPAIRHKISEGLRHKWTDLNYRGAVLGSLDRVRTSSIQISLYDYLDDLGVAYHKEGASTTFGFYVFDCLVPEHKLLIECQGDYWHSLPNAIRNDKAKFTYISKYFPEYTIMYVWEREFYEKDSVLDRIKLRLNIGLEVEQFELKDLNSKIIDRQISNDFLHKYHYLGKSRGGIDYGLFLGSTLIAVARFSPLIRQNIAHQFPENTVELSRLCVHPKYHKKNLLSWWIARIPIRPIVSYSDTTVGHTGAVYKASGFKLHHTTEADYWYTNCSGYVMHKKTLYNRAVNLKMTEKEFADKHGYYKKYGGSKLCFIKQK
jgi:hypothetical protein